MLYQVGVKGGIELDLVEKAALILLSREGMLDKVVLREKPTTLKDVEDVENRIKALVTAVCLLLLCACYCCVPS